MSQFLANFVLIAAMGFLAPAAQALAADKVTMSSTNITAFDLDQIVAQHKGFFAKENIDFEPTYLQPDLAQLSQLAAK